MPSTKQLSLAKKIHRQNRGWTGRVLGNRRCYRVTAREDMAFLRAMKEAFSAHYLSSQELQGHCEEQDFYPWNLKRLSQISQIPGAEGWDSSHLRSGTEKRRLRSLADHMFGELGLLNSVKTNYLRLSSEDNFLLDLLQGLTRSSYVADFADSESELWDVALATRCLERLELSGRPFRLLGQAHTIKERLAQILESRGDRPFRFGPNSHVLVSGGWTGVDSSPLERRSFREKVSQWLGLPCRNIRDVYSPMGHDVPYVECEAFRYHIPSFSKILVRDSATLEVLEPGQEGLLHFLSPYPDSSRKISYLSGEQGLVLEQCPCGRKSSVFELTGTRP